MLKVLQVRRAQQKARWLPEQGRKKSPVRKWRGGLQLEHRVDTGGARDQTHRSASPSCSIGSEYQRVLFEILCVLLICTIFLDLVKLLFGGKVCACEGDECQRCGLRADFDGLLSGYHLCHCACTCNRRAR